MKMKYKIGDKVKIREDLIVDNIYGSDSFAEEMEQYKGKTATITDIYRDKYEIDLDDGDWCWTDDMFEDNVVVESEAVVESKDDIKAQTVDIGYYLEYCGHRVVKNVYYGGYTYDKEHVFCTTINGGNQYTLPVDAIEFVIPHEVD